MVLKAKKSTKPLVTFYILSYNEKDYIKGAIRSIENIDFDHPIQIIIIDNGSVDGTIPYLQKSFPQHQLIESGKNMGTAAFNLAIPFTRGKYIAFLASDMTVEKDSIKILVDYMENHKDVGGLHPKFKNFEKKETLEDYVFSRSFYWMSISTLNTIRGAMSLGPGFVRTEIIKKIGGIYDPFYFYSYEDQDLAMRIKLFGYQVLFHPKAVFYHLGNVGFKKTRTDSQRIFLSTRNQTITMIKISAFHNLVWTLPYMLLIRSAVILYDLVRLRFSNAFARLKGSFWVLANLHFVLRKRMDTQVLRHVKDSFIFDQADELQFIYHVLKKILTFKSVEVHY